ncbi:MAG: rhomboid family intramembrane serine protease [Armatimonadota bacterium]|nr:rhomboid family intramembrane serine protease [Armatimonadota bacterium]MDR7401943.1 rhomboid family intramembrane serine protease [Armatimonadota bacterium]MDR7403676.1 rhomboid family intramembrane serine protease [Armatimonadota bacterium]MDR7437285.1 rhomboid family intramembrane serine protease [Armatimonadota bacterium]MDR7471506.1 rhomboid family intramembrane serine protease [Armatimonadota bacterium]
MTWAVIAGTAVTFLLSFVGAGAVVSGLLFVPGSLLARPWSALTYPLVAGGHVLWVLVSAYVLWVFGGSLERAWGSHDYAVFLALVTAVPALALAGAAAALGRAVILAGLGLPLAAVVVAWSAINPRERVLAYFAIPVPGQWLGAIAAILVVFSFPFPLGVFALTGCAAAVWYVRAGRYGLRPARFVRRLPAMGTLNPVRAWQRWRLRRRFLRVVRSLEADDPDRRVH